MNPINGEITTVIGRGVTGLFAAATNGHRTYAETPQGGFETRSGEVKKSPAVGFVTKVGHPGFALAATIFMLEPMAMSFAAMIMANGSVARAANGKRSIRIEHETMFKIELAPQRGTARAQRTA